MSTAALIKRNISLGLVHSFSGLVHYCHGDKHDSMQADMVLEKKLRVLHLDLLAAEETVCHTGCSLSM